MSERSLQTADDNRKVISRALKLTLVLYTVKLVIYFNWIIISNRIKYYLLINRENSADTVWLLQECSSDSPSAMAACYWKSNVPRTQGSWYLERDCLEHHGERSLNLCYSIKSLMLVSFLTGGTEIVNAQGSVKDWYILN